MDENRETSGPEIVEAEVVEPRRPPTGSPVLSIVSLMTGVLMMAIFMLWWSISRGGPNGLQPEEDIPFVVALVFFLLGIALFTLGLIGIYRYWKHSK